MKPLVIYHGNCADGFTAAWAAYRKFGHDADYFPGVYQNPPPLCAGREVYLLDFSYKRPVVLEMATNAKLITILDHHKSAIDDLGDILTMEGFAGRFDIEKSGARIAWEWFHPDSEVPRLVQIVEDRDLWRFKLPGCREMMASIFSYAYDFETWDTLYSEFESSTGTHDHFVGGTAIERKHHKDISELVATFKRRMVIGGIEVWAANLPYTLTSDAGHLMCGPDSPFAACYWDTPEGRVFSLRSRDDGPDVAEIAKKYGGGGHAHASGFRLPHGANP